MITFRKANTILGIKLCLLFIANNIYSQELAPRAYLWVPKNTTTLVTGFLFSDGEILTDATLPVENVKAQIQGLSLGVSHTFAVMGMSSQLFVLAPYSWANVSGDLNEEATEINRSGFSDMRVRLSVLFHNAPASTMKEIAQSPRKTIFGASLNVVVPTGQYFSDKLINLGANRWAFFPELAISHPISKKWLLDCYAGVWLFTDNNSFYPGDSIRSQEPLGAIQGHLSYNITPFFWVAINSTYYVGGNSAVNDIVKDDRASNSRIGLTTVFPTGKLSSLKLAVSTGAVVRIGQNFNTVSIGWQKSWIEGYKRTKKEKTKP